MKKTLLLASLILLNVGLYAQVKKTDDVPETFVGRSLNELDRVAANVGEEIKDLFRKKQDYKPFTNNHEKPIKSHIVYQNESFKS